MKPWAKVFYLSANWKQTAASYLKSVNYICERCGGIAKIVHHKKYLTKNNINNPYITLSWANLEALCQDCHNKEHHKKTPTLRYEYDSDGNIIYPPHCDP